MWTMILIGTLACVQIAVIWRLWSLERRSADLASELGRLSPLAARQASTASTLLELAEVRDAVDKGNRLLKRINSREVMAARKADAKASEDEAPSDPAALKAYLRKKAGLVAGQPAPHHE